eukprot:CAMPEP_0198256518 /NCGR_PEP_ID=MMETSP1447-20131203/6432_1 /TAXON_ID=420782 /ORGANISM="Chaetoceros dichaeta, Strain CCMP1751" /LENGTH=209 /DNA_ID=CAMNT_0043943195 /DNA_START=113 /DNA_END=738 /DNA_ORIENTATION=+
MSTTNGATATAGATQPTSSPVDASSKETATTNDAPTSSASDGAAVTAATEEEEDLAKLQAEIAKMEEEAARIAQETADLEKGKASKTSGIASAGGQADGGGAAGATDGVSRDGLSIYVGQVEYTATPEELCAHFEPCGTVERVTIVCDKFSGRPKGFAYLEFQSEDGVVNAVKLDGSTFKGRTLKVTHKRVNEPGYHYNQAAAGGRGGG